MTEAVIRIPKERVGVLIGPDGETKQEIEERSGVHLDIESDSGEVHLDDEDAFEPVLTLKVRDVVRAIARGFSPEKAFRLFQDDAYLDVVDLTDYVGKSSKHLNRVRGRVIGTGGKTRQALEDFTGAHVSIYGKTVAMVGDIGEVRAAREAVEMIANGAPHSAVYGFLEKKRRELRMEELGLG